MRTGTACRIALGADWPHLSDTDHAHNWLVRVRWESADGHSHWPPNGPAFSGQSQAPGHTDGCAPRQSVRPSPPAYRWEDVLTCAHPAALPVPIAQSGSATCSPFAAHGRPRVPHPKCADRHKQPESHRRAPPTASHHCASEPTVPALCARSMSSLATCVGGTWAFSPYPRLNTRNLQDAAPSTR